MQSLEKDGSNTKALVKALRSSAKALHAEGTGNMLAGTGGDQVQPDLEGKWKFGNQKMQQLRGLIIKKEFNPTEIWIKAFQTDSVSQSDILVRSLRNAAKPFPLASVAPLLIYVSFQQFHRSSKMRPS